jgi:hypothetical protein
LAKIENACFCFFQEALSNKWRQEASRSALVQSQTQSSAEDLMMPLGETLKIPGVETATEDAKDGPEQQQPRGNPSLDADTSPAVTAGS